MLKLKQKGKKEPAWVPRLGQRYNFFTFLLLCRRTSAMDFQNRVGSKIGGGGVASWSETNRQRKERLTKLAMETIDLQKVRKGRGQRGKQWATGKRNWGPLVMERMRPKPRARATKRVR